MWNNIGTEFNLKINKKKERKKNKIFKIHENRSIHSFFKGC